MSEPLRVFVGVDPRQPIGYNVLQWAIHTHAAGRVQIEPLMLGKLPLKRRGLTEFTFSRFLVPWLCDYRGTAVFMDADIMVTGDIGDLFAQADGESCVQVMQAQKKFEWPSVMLFNCDRCEILTPEYVEDPAHKLLSLDFGPVGTLTPEWNHCVGYMPAKVAKLYHYTQGLPCWPETRGLPEDVNWTDGLRAATHTVGWQELMGGSVHAPYVLGRMFEKYGIKVAGVAEKPVSAPAHA